MLRCSRYSQKYRHPTTHSAMRCGRRGCGGCSESISAHFQGLQTSVQLPATTWSAQIWISGWILSDFDVRTISVASKLKKLQIFLYYCQKIFDGTKLDSDGERSKQWLWVLLMEAYYTCSYIAALHSGRVFWLNKYTQYTHWTKNPDFAHCAMYE